MQIIYPQDRKAIHPVGIFKEGFGLWLKNFFALSGAYLVIYAPLLVINISIAILFPANDATSVEKIFFGAVSLLQWFAGMWAVIAFLLINIKAQAPGNSAIENIIDAKNYILPYLGNTVLFLLFLALISLLGAGLFLLGVFCLAIKQAILGIIVMLVSAIPCLFAIVYFAIRLSLGGVVCVAEKTGPVIALKRSHELVKKYVTPVVGAYCLNFLAVLIFVILQVLFSLIFKKFSQTCFDIAAQSFQFAAGLVLVPLLAAISLVLYNKLKEAVEPKK